MAFDFHKQSYIEAFARLEDACAWMEGLGIKVQPTRLGRYRRIFADLARRQADDKLDEFLQRHSFAEWVNAAYEAVEIVRVYEGLRAVESQHLVARLKSALRGHVDYVLDEDDRSGRNFAFELSVASYFARAGLTVSFNHDADIVVEVEGLTIFVECKRLKSEKQVAVRIKEGLRQLETRYGQAERPAFTSGILVLSIGRLLNPRLGFLESSSPESLLDLAHRHNLAFVTRHSSSWKGAIDSRTLGIVVVLDAPGMIMPGYHFTTVRQTAVVPFTTAGGDEDALLRLLVEIAFSPPGEINLGET